MNNAFPSPVEADLPPPPPSLAKGASLFLDFDGTLVELEDRPDLVRAGPDLIDLIRRLSGRLDGRVALVSGRSAADIRERFADLALAIGGSHGLEVDWVDGRRDRPAPPATLDRVRAAFERLVERNPGTLIEHKPFGVAFHYRAAPDLEAEAAALARDLAAETGLAVQPGKMMIELRLGGVDKGAAVRAFTGEPPMAGTRPIFMGDDLTDEPAFATCAALGGCGILVGPPRATAASYRLPDVRATLAWLEGVAGRSAA